MKRAVFRDITLYSPLTISWSFRRNCHNLQGLKNQPSKKPAWHRSQAGTASCWFLAWLFLQMLVICSSETLVDFQQATLRCILEHRTLHNNCYENFKSYLEEVDLKDQKLQPYEIEMKEGIKLYPELFKRLLNMWIYNAFVLYKKTIKGPSFFLTS